MKKRIRPTKPAEVEELLSRSTCDESDTAGGNGGPAVDIDSSYLRVDKIKVPKQREYPILEVNKEIVANHVHSEDGERHVIAHHRHHFRAVFARYMEHAEYYIAFADRHIQDLNARIASCSKRLQNTDQFVRRECVGDERTPWNTLDRVTFVFLIIVSVALLGIGINTLATYLIGSGYVVFAETPALAFLLSAVNVGIAALLKAGSSWCPDDRSRHRYFLGLWALGLTSGSIWVATFSTLFPNIQTESIGELIAGLSAEGTGSSNTLEGIFVGSQLVAEICIASALWIHLEKLWRSHAPPIEIEANLEYKTRARAIAAWNEKLRGALEKKAELVGALKEIQHREAAFLLAASSELAAQRNAFREAAYRLTE